MPDIYNAEKRSEIMSKISSKETKPEILVRKYLFALGLRYRKNLASLPGKPDIVLPKYNTIIFVNGCFWHGHDCKAAKLPATRTEFWTTKIASNKTRDAKNYEQLALAGWKVIIVWQCSIKNKQAFASEMDRVIACLQS